MSRVVNAKLVVLRAGVRVADHASASAMPSVTAPHGHLRRVQDQLSVSAVIPNLAAIDVTVAHYDSYS